MGTRTDATRQQGLAPAPHRFTGKGLTSLFAPLPTSLTYLSENQDLAVVPPPYPTSGAHNAQPYAERCRQTGATGLWRFGSNNAVGPSLLQNNKMSEFALTFAIYLKDPLPGSPLPSGESPLNSLATQREMTAEVGRWSPQRSADVLISCRAAVCERQCCAGTHLKSFLRAARAFPCRFCSLFFISGLCCLLLFMFIWLFSFNE